MRGMKPGIAAAQIAGAAHAFWEVAKRSGVRMGFGKMSRAPNILWIVTDAVAGVGVRLRWRRERAHAVRGRTARRRA